MNAKSAPQKRKERKKRQRPPNAKRRAKKGSWLEAKKSEKEDRKLGAGTRGCDRPTKLDPEPDTRAGCNDVEGFYHDKRTVCSHEAEHDITRMKTTAPPPLPVAIRRTHVTRGKAAATTAVKAVVRPGTAYNPLAPTAWTLCREDDESLWRFAQRFAIWQIGNERQISLSGPQ